MDVGGITSQEHAADGIIRHDHAALQAAAVAIKTGFQDPFRLELGECQKALRQAFKRRVL
jgi:hypothetical protein